MQLYMYVLFVAISSYILCSCTCWWSCRSVTWWYNQTVIIIAETSVANTAEHISRMLLQNTGPIWGVKFIREAGFVRNFHLAAITVKYNNTDKMAVIIQLWVFITHFISTCTISISTLVIFTYQLIYRMYAGPRDHKYIILFNYNYFL